MKRAKNWALLGGAVFVALIIAELVVRAVVLAPPNMYFVDPDVGARYVPHFQGKYHGLPIAINAHGLRDYEYSYEKPEGVFRIVCVGDSVTVGLGVSEIDDVYPNILERELRAMGKDVEVINMGFGGYNTAQEIALFRKEGVRYDPDMVILAVNLNDYEPPHSNLERAKFFDAYNVLWFREFLRKNIFLLTYGKRVMNVVRARMRTSVPSQLDGAHVYDECGAQIADFYTYLSEKGIGLLVYILPNIEDFDVYPYAKAHETLGHVLTSVGVHYYDLLPYFQDSLAEDLWFTETDHHPNEKGHAIIAQGMLVSVLNHLDGASVADSA